MDVTTLGIKLDAQPFIDGERKVTEALGRIAQSTTQATSAFEAQARAAQTAFQAMASAVAQAERTIVAGMNHIANATKLAGDAMEASGKKGATGASAFQGISAAAQQQISQAFDAVAQKLASVGAALDAHAAKHRETFTAIESAVSQASNRVGTALSSVTDKLSGTNTALDRQATTAQSGFGSLQRNAEQTGTAVNTMTAAVNQVPASVAAATTAVTGMSQATASLSTSAAAVGAATQGATRSVDQFAGNVRRRSWETAEAFDKQRAASAASFTSMDGAARTTSGNMSNVFTRIRDAIAQTSPALGELVTAVGNMGRGFMTATAGIRAFVATMATVSGIGAAVLAVLGPIALAITAINIAMKAWNATVGLFSMGLQQAAKTERMTLGFAELTGSIDMAEKRMQSLRQLALGGVFSLEEFVAASTILEKTTDGLWSNEAALKAVGNAAAKSNISISEAAKLYGGFLQSLRSGGGWEEKIKELRNANLVTPEIYKQIGQMVEGGARISEVWGVVMGELDKAGGAMDRLSTLYVSKIGEITAKWKEFRLILGEAILPAAKSALESLVPIIEQLIRWAKESRAEIQATADSIVAAMNVMLQPGGFSLTMQAAGEAFAAAIDNGWQTTSNQILDWVKTKFGIDIKTAWNDVRNADIWSTLENEIIPRIAISLANALKRAIIQAFSDLGDTISLGLTKKIREALTNQIQSNQGFVGATTNVLTRKFAEYQSMISAPLPDNGNQPTGIPPNFFNLGQSPPRIPPFKPDGINVNVEIPSDFVPAEGAVGADLLPKSIDSLTKAISDVRQQSALPATGPSADLFGAMGPENDTFAARRNAEIARIRDLREMQKPARELNAPRALPVGEDFIIQPPKELKTRRALSVPRDPMETEAARITEQMRNPAEVYRDTVANLEKLRDKFADTGKFTTDTFNRAMAKAKEDYMSSVKAMEAAAKAAAEAQMTDLQKLGANWSDMGKQIDAANVAIAQSIASNLTNAFVGIIDGTKSASDAFAEMADRIVADLLRIISQMMVAKAIGTAIGFFNPVAGQAAAAMLMPQGAGGFLGGAKTAAPAPVAAPTMHTGGVVGETMGASKVTDPKIFKSAPRYHQGGMVGLQPGEVPIIAQKGEVISTEDQERMRERLRGDTQRNRQQIAVTNVNVVDATMIDEHLNKNPDAIINLISRQKGKVKQILNIGT